MQYMCSQCCKYLGQC
ncbi:hypothetical protein D039_1657A, partial [Vibrio parahaemolyticus EKP-028]